MKYKHTGWIWFWGLAGCTLAEAPDISEPCPEARYYTNADATKSTDFSDTTSEYYELFLSTKSCPSAYPVCGKNAEGSFCHEACRDKEIFCNTGCIYPQTDSEHCGARGNCTDTSSDSPNFSGRKCEKSQRCVNGQCGCGRKGNIECGGQCIDPLSDMAYCGAKGLCSDADPDSENYQGEACDRNHRCVDGRCTCGREGDVVCNQVCIDPQYDDDHCGAKGLCTDTEPNSPDFQGQICTGDQRCDGGVCVCAKNWEVFCDATACINPENSVKHCGAAGACSDPEASSPDFIGGDCNQEAGGYCLDGVCQCPKEYHLYQNSCEKTDDINCGSHDNSCVVSRYKHSTGVKCQNDACVVTGCEPGAFLSADNKSCLTCSDLVTGVKKGDSFYFGRYQQLAEDNTKYPIEWLVLANDADGVVVMSKYVLDGDYYHNKNGGRVISLTWEECTLRSWLNGLDKEHNKTGIDYTDDNFISTAFNEEELKCIQESEIENISNPEFGTAGGNNTKDKIFLLSLCEAGYESSDTQTPCPKDGAVYFNSDEERIAYATGYARSKNIPLGRNDYEMYDRYYIGVHYSTEWWLRSPGKTKTQAMIVKLIVNPKVDNHFESMSTFDTPLGIRPAMKLHK